MRDKFFPLVRCLVAALLLAVPAVAQLTTVTGSQVDAGQQPAGTAWTLCFTPTGVASRGFHVGSTGQASGQQVCRDVQNGIILTTLRGTIIGPMLVADTSLSAPENLCYVVTLKDANGNIILGGIGSGYACVQPSGGTWSFDSYIPNEPSQPLGQSITDLVVENLTVTTCDGCSSGLPSGSGNEILATPADGSSGTAGLRSMVPADVPALPESATTSLTSDLAAKENHAALAAVAESGSYNDLSNTPSSLPPSGAAGGKLSGSYPNPGVSLEASDIPSIAESQVTNLPSDLDAKENHSALATVAESGSYNDLSNKPTIPAAQIQSDWNESNNLLLDFIKNKPSIPSTTIAQALALYTNNSGALGQAVNGVNVIFSPGSASIRRSGVAPIDVFAGDNGGGQGGIDSAASIPYRDYVPYCRNEGTAANPLACTDILYIGANYPTSTLNGAVTSAGCNTTGIVTQAALTQPGAISGLYYVMMGTNTVGTQENVAIASGWGTTTLVAANPCTYNHGNAELITVLNAKYSRPTIGLGKPQPDPNFAVEIASDYTNDPSQGLLKLDTSTAQTQDSIQVITPSPSYEFYMKSGGVMVGSFRNNPATVSDMVTNSTTTITSATANFSAEYDFQRPVHGTNIPAGDYITSVTNATTAVLKVAATGSGSGGSLTRYWCGLCLNDLTVSGPGFTFNPDVNAGIVNYSICFGDGCDLGNVAGQLGVTRSGTSDATVFIKTASQAALTCKALGPGNDWAQCYTNNKPFHLGTNSLDAIVMDTSQNTALAGHLNQTASGKFGGTCAMSSGTTCTVTLAAAYTTPVCIVTVAGRQPHRGSVQRIEHDRHRDGREL
ncbi:MAG: hypothetical protein WA655_01880 [Candidatus Korobacteraceae bacterium]